MALPAYTETTDVTRLLPSTTYAVANTHTTVTPKVASYFRPCAKGARFFVNVSAISGTSAAVTLSIKEFNPQVGASGTAGNTIIATAALIATGMVVLDVYPGLTASANAVVSNVMSNFVIDVFMSNTTTPSATVTVDVEYIP